MNKTSQKRSKRWVIKIGSALLTNNGTALNQQGISDWVRQIAHIRQQGIAVVLVSSGAVAAGVARMGWPGRPHQLPEIQAAAAIGQMGLMQTYDTAFATQGCQAAQILLTHDDFADRGRYLNARNTLLALLRLQVVPIVNENDTVVTDEIKFGDNDTLAALVANLIEADRLVILTDQQGLYDADPRTHTDAQLIRQAKARDARLEQCAGGASAVGRGGMITKVRSAQIAARSGADTIIAGGVIPNVLVRLAQAEALGTCLQAEENPLTARKRWIAGHLQPKGSLILDQGASRALVHQGRSLLAAGIVQFEGRFSAGDLVQCLDPSSRLIAKGFTNYSSDEVAQVRGLNTQALAATLGYEGPAEVIHRDNLVIL